jgi:hypothetical protein
VRGVPERDPVQDRREIELVAEAGSRADQAERDDAEDGCERQCAQG